MPNRGFGVKSPLLGGKKMIVKVKQKQTGSRDCVVCGMENPFGCHAQFYSMEDDTCVALFKYNAMNQSYPHRTHGGMIAAILDETIGRAIWCTEPETWGVTMKLEVEYHKPCPYDEDLICVGRIIKSTRMTFEGTAELYDKQGNLLDKGHATYFKLPLEKAVQGDSSLSADDVNVLYPDDVTEIDVPTRNR